MRVGWLCEAQLEPRTELKAPPPHPVSNVIAGDAVLVARQGVGGAAAVGSSGVIICTLVLVRQAD
jgi:hypothetical protein